MRAVQFGVLPLLILISGCASLQWQADDGTGTKLAKTATRIPLGLVTLGISEIAIERNSDAERAERARLTRARYFQDLQAKLTRYREMAENGKTPEERETALRLADGVLSEMRTAFGESGGSAQTTCVMVPIGGVLVQRCQ